MFLQVSQKHYLSVNVLSKQIKRNTSVNLLKYLFKKNNLLYLIIFLPLFGRSLIPLNRDTSSITIISSFADPQMICTYILAFYCLFQWIRRPGTFFWIMRAPLLPFFIFNITCIISIFISSDPLFSLWRSFETFIMLMWSALVIAQLSEDECVDQMLRVFYFISAIMLCAVIAGLILHSQHAWNVESDHMLRLTGGETYMMGPNTVGVIASLLCLATFARVVLFLKPRYLIGTLIFLIIAYLASSRAAFVALATGFGVLIIPFLQIRNRMFFVMIYYGLFLFLIASLLFIAPEFHKQFVEVLTRGKSWENVLSFSGRIPLWELSWKYFLKAPILGYGYGCYPPGFSGHGHFHNYFIEVSLTTGLLGILPVIYLVFSSIAKLTKKLLSFNRFSNEEKLIYIDVLTIGLVILISNLATAGAAYYSWDMIGLVVLVIGAQILHNSSFAPP